MKSFWNGSAKKLLGSCLVVGVFVSEEENKWTLKNKEKTWENVHKSMDWILEQSLEYEVDLSFEYLCLNMDSDLTVDRIPSFSEDIEKMNLVLEEVAGELDYENVTDLYQSIKADYEEYNIHLIVFMNKDDRSYMSSIAIDDEVKELEYNIIYTEEGVITSSTIAHESLHAYTAFDLYNVSGTPEGEAIEKKARRKTKEEIMLSTVENVEETNLSEFTAFLVGWHNDPKDWYKSIVQKGDMEALTFLMKNCDHYDEKGNLIIEKEEEILKFTYDEGEFIRFRINDSDDFIHWKQIVSETEEEIEFWETHIDDDSFYLEAKTGSECINIPKEGGLSLRAEGALEYEDWLEMEKVENV